MVAITKHIELLQALLREMRRVTVAVSGGVDSMTLAHIAHLTLGENATMVHSCSAAVPQADTRRIEIYAHNQGWQLNIVRAGEMDSPAYQKNPVDRCYYCKTALYSTLNALDCGVVVSGTNTDDLSDFRPGLIAAQEQQVRHPFVEANINKTTIRAIARYYQLDDIADLPASPCLSSRVATGIPIQPGQLELIQNVENWLRTKISAENIRCRFFSQRLVLQIDEYALTAMSPLARAEIVSQVQNMAQQNGLNLSVDLAAYLRGSAFIRVA